MKLAFDLIFRTRFHLVSPLSLLRTFHKKLFPVFGEVALLLFGLAQPLECHVVPDHISRSAALAYIIAVEAWSNCQRPVIRANENIPTLRHRVETTLEEQSLWSSFRTSSGFMQCRLRTNAECMRTRGRIPTVRKC
jgi:hypothetical protein